MRRTAKKLLLLSLIVSLLCSLLWMIQIKRKSLYPYDVTSNYDYDFSNNNTFKLNLDLEHGKLKISELDEVWDTAFLKVNVKTTFLGRYSQPRVELTASDLTIFQDIEHGAQGTRYINLSQFICLGEREISLKGHNISINDQPVELILFKNPGVRKAKLLVIAPHPDDAEIAAYGLYSSNRDSYIVTVTAGDAGRKKYDEVYRNDIKHYLKKGELRVWNSITVPLLGGVPPEHAINLGYFDSTLKTMYLDKETLVQSKFTQLSDVNFFRGKNVSKLISSLHATSTWRSLVNDMQYLLNEIKPNIIVAPYLAIDFHHDHKLSTIALFEAIKKLNLKEGDLYLYTNHHVLSKFYPHGQIGSSISLPPNFGESLYFQRIYSHILPVDKQNDKLFALDAMNDLRLDTEWRITHGAAKIFIKTLEKNIFGRDSSYFRRAVRANELFFVVPIKEIYDDEIYEKLKGNLDT